MGIPENQLETWSHQGSVKQSRDTYESIKRVLEDPNAPYAKYAYSIFLQGSYANDTNVYAESDVDVVMLLESTFQHDLERLSDVKKEAFHKAYESSTYNYYDFKKDVIGWLTHKFGNCVKPGNKAILVKGENNRRDADVLPAIRFRRYFKFEGMYDQNYAEGICFFTKNGVRIVNYPKQHAEHCTRKHKHTNNRFKSTVRVLKNIRNHMIDESLISDDLAPSYYLEGLLYNVPDGRFGSSHADTFESSMDYIVKADREKFLCANEQYYLLHPNSPVTWRKENCDAFLEGALTLWKNWGK